MVKGPSECKQDQIFNPETKRCVSIDGGPGKKIMKAFQKGTSTLSSEEIKKVLSFLKTAQKANVFYDSITNDKNKDQFLNIWKPKPSNALATSQLAKVPQLPPSSVNQTTTPKSSSQIADTPKKIVTKKKDITSPKDVWYSPIPEAAPETPKSNCNNNQVLHPTTNSCIQYHDSDFKKLVNLILQGKLNPKLQAVQSVIDAALSPQAKQYITAKKRLELQKLKSKEETHIIQVSDKVKEKIHHFVESWKKQRDERLYIDESHRKFCANKKVLHVNKPSTDMKKPFVRYGVNVDLPIKKMVQPTFSFPKHELDLPKQNFITQLMTCTTFSFNNYSIRNILFKGTKGSMTYFEDVVDSEWLDEMNKYVSNLKTSEIYTLIGYSFYGDVIANSYMRKKLDESQFMKDVGGEDKWLSYYPLFFQALTVLDTVQDQATIIRNKDIIIIPNIIRPTITFADKSLLKKAMKISEILKLIQSKSAIKTSDKYTLLSLIGNELSFKLFWEKVIVQYISDLDRIIRNSPPLKKPMIVYRGVTNDYYLKGTAGHVYRTDSFVSTSMNFSSSLKFAGFSCCFKRITLLPGTRALLLAGVSRFQNEVELLLGPQSQFYITKYKSFMSKDTTAICPISKTNITVTDAVVIK